jgi:CubicO group peptidase (beta-lactamase class C family)
VLHYNHFVLRPPTLLVISLAVAVWACSRGASTSDRAGTRIDALFAEWNTRESPGCGVGVMRNGAMLFERGYGMANLERKIPISASTIFDPASIAKPFTALSIMLLAGQGKLSLDDEVWKHVPEWVDRQDRVTIRHLLGHTAGLRDAFLLIELAPPPAPGVDINQHILRTLARQRGVNFPPSTEFSYNNGGYNVLGSIVARVSGQAFRDFATAHIFRPLGMSHSSFRVPSRSQRIMHSDITVTNEDFISLATVASIPRRSSATRGSSRQSVICCGSRRTSARLGWAVVTLSWRCRRPCRSAITVRALTASGWRSATIGA